MLKVLFTRSSYFSCLHNMVAVFLLYPPIPKIKKWKCARKFPTTGWSSPCGFLIEEELTAFTSSADHQAHNRRGLNDYRNHDICIEGYYTVLSDLSLILVRNPPHLNATPLYSMQYRKPEQLVSNTVMKKKVYRQSKSVQHDPMKASTEGLNLFCTRKSLSYSQEIQSEEKVTPQTFGQTNSL